ncbi:MAG: hypothetical protein ACYTEU_05500 [Planctomycetota bacterium]|jgi:hypothetical protein
MPAFFIAPKRLSGGVFAVHGHNSGQQNMTKAVGTEVFQIIGRIIQFYRAVKVKQPPTE